MDSLQAKLVQERKHRQSQFVWEGIEAAGMVLEGFRQQVNTGTLKISAGCDPYYIFDPSEFAKYSKTAGSPPLEPWAWVRQSRYVLDAIRDLTGMRVVWEGPGYMIRLYEDEESDDAMAMIARIVVPASASDPSRRVTFRPPHHSGRQKRKMPWAWTDTQNKDYQPMPIPSSSVFGPASTPGATKTKVLIDMVKAAGNAETKAKAAVGSIHAAGSAAAATAAARQRPRQRQTIVLCSQWELYWRMGGKRSRPSRTLAAINHVLPAPAAPH